MNCNLVNNEYIDCRGGLHPPAKERRHMKNTLSVILLSLTTLNYPYPSSASDTTSPLTKIEQSSAKKGNNYAGTGKAEKAQSAYQVGIDQAVSVEQCLALIKITEHYGSILSPVRRNCLTKALSLAKTDDDYFQIIIAARQCQFYEITKQCIDALIARAKTKEQLLTLAHKAQSMAINDVAHIAMEKLDMQILSATPTGDSPTNSTQLSNEEFFFAKEAKLMAMEDLMRKAIKDMLDQEQTTHGLCLMVKAVQPLEVPDLQRKILRKAVYQVTNVDDCKEVYEAARIFGQQDIVDLAAFKGRKMILMDQSHTEQDAIKEQQEALKQEQELKDAEETGQIPPNTATPNKQDNKTAPAVIPGF